MTALRPKLDRYPMTAEPFCITASWPRHLQELWHACAERGEVDARNPPASVVEAYLQGAEARVRRWASIPWGDPTDMVRYEEEDFTQLCGFVSNSTLPRRAGRIQLVPR